MKQENLSAVADFIKYNDMTLAMDTSIGLTCDHFHVVLNVLGLSVTVQILTLSGKGTIGSFTIKPRASKPSLIMIRDRSLRPEFEQRPRPVSA